MKLQDIFYIIEPQNMIVLWDHIDGIGLHPLGTYYGLKDRALKKTYENFKDYNVIRIDGSDWNEMTIIIEK